MTAGLRRSQLLPDRDTPASWHSHDMIVHILLVVFVSSISICACVCVIDHGYPLVLTFSRSGADKLLSSGIVAQSQRFINTICFDTTDNIFCQ